MSGINQVLGTDKALRLNDFTLLGLVQSNDWNPEFNAQTINEMGKDTRVAVSYELETRGQFELIASGNTAGLLARMKVKRDGSGVFTGYAYTPGGAAGKNGYTFTQTDLREMQFDIVMHEKPDQATFSRSVWIPRAFLTQFSGRVDANANATETFQWMGQFSESFKAPFHDIRSNPALVTDGVTLTLTDVAITSTTHTLAYVMVDERVFTAKAGDASHFALNADGTLTLTTSEGYVIPATAVCRVLAYKTVPGTAFPVLLGTDRGTTAFSIRGYNADVFIAPAVEGTPTEAEKWLKVQTVTWDVNLRVDTLRQIAKNDFGTSIYARVPTFPIEIKLSFNVTESDWADWKAMMTKSFTGALVYDNTYSFAPKTFKGTFAVVIKMYNKDGALLQTWDFSDLYIDGSGQRVNVGGRAEVQWSTAGSAFTLTGVNA